MIIKKLNLCKTIDNNAYKNEYHKKNHYICDICDVNVGLNHKNRHMKTANHQNNRNKKNITDSDDNYLRKIKID